MRCGDRTLAIAHVVSLAAAAMVAAALYAFFALRHPATLKHWVSTFSILMAHLQTLSIVAKLRLNWPQSAEAVFSAMVVNGLQLDGARPRRSSRRNDATSFNCARVTTARHINV